MAKTHAVRRLIDSPRFNFWGPLGGAIIEVYSWLSDVEPEYVAALPRSS